MNNLTLHGFFNSSASYRVRIALNLKGLDWAHAGVNIRTGEQATETYRHLNPAALVPTLDHDGHALTQSLAIIDYLDRLQPEPLLIRQDGAERQRALVRTEIESIIGREIDA